MSQNIISDAVETVTTPSAAAAAPSPSLTVGTVTNMAAIVAEVERQIARVRAMDRAVQDTQDALDQTLNAEQKALFRDYEAADNDRDFAQMDLYLLDLGRHLPGLHPAIWALWRHIIESRQGECCMPNPAG